MKSKLIKLAAVAIVSLLGFGVAISPAFAANSCDNICSPDCEVAQSVKEAAGCGNEVSENSLPSAVQGILNVVISITGIIAVIFIIIGGVQYMTSAGDAGKAKKARDTTLYAVIGLIVVILSFVIVNFVIANIGSK